MCCWQWPQSLLLPFCKNRHLLALAVVFWRFDTLYISFISELLYLESAPLFLHPKFSAKRSGRRRPWKAGQGNKTFRTVSPMPWVLSQWNKIAQRASRGSPTHPEVQLLWNFCLQFFCNVDVLWSIVDFLSYCNSHLKCASCDKLCIELAYFEQNVPV